jgi:copper homeostasis protein
MRDIIFELCAETLPACLAAREAGAHRIELCSALDLGGLTPALNLVRDAVAQTSLPIHTMIRPRVGNFLYSTGEFLSMQQAITHMKALGATGIVFGILNPDNTVDIDRTRALVALAHPMQITFHRAFDETPNLPQALEDLLTTGCHRILTSGGQTDVLTGAPMLAKLIARANSRIVIAAGGGLRQTNAADVARLTRAHHFHGSLRRTATADPHPTDIRSIIETLRNA